MLSPRAFFMKEDPGRQTQTSAGPPRQCGHVDDGTRVLLPATGRHTNDDGTKWAHTDGMEAGSGRYVR